MTRREAIKQGGILALSLPITNIKTFNTMENNQQFDVIIIGGSYSGLSAAMALGRSLRKVLIIDSGLPCNRQTPESHNFITQDGVAPHEIAQKAKAQVMNYDTVQFLEDLAIAGRKIDEGFEITTKSKQKVVAKKLIFATGIRDIMPDIKGFADCWGISVVHCPYCHGYEIKHQKTGIIANGEVALHLAPMVKNLTNDLTILTTGKANFSPEELTKFEKHKINIIEKGISEIEHVNGHIKQIVFEDQTIEKFDATYAHLSFEQHTDIPETLGCELNDQGYIQVDMMMKTSIEGIFACGDNTSRLRSVANAVNSGNMAGAIVNMELSNEAF